MFQEGENKMKLVSWNVAGFRACLKKGFEDFFYSCHADIYCLQEVKAQLDEIDFMPKDYYCYINTAEKKGYSGTIIYSLYKPINVTYGLGIEKYDNEGRIITLEFEEYYLVNQYVPNVKRDLSRLKYRMDFEEEFKKYVKKLENKKPVVICGDFNVAHTEADIKNAKSNIGNAGFTYEEREKFTQLLESGFVDTYRYFNSQKKDAYTWWSYMHNARSKNIGWRIDYFLVSKSIIHKVFNPKIYFDVFGSDHCPIGLELKFK